MKPSDLERRDLLRLGFGLAASPSAAAAQTEGGTEVGWASASADVWVRFFAVQRLWAYADRLSLEPGERFNVMASTGPDQPDRRARLEVFRIGAAGASTQTWTSEFVNIGHHGPTASAAAIGPGWPIAFAAIDTSTWPPGVYSADLVEQITATRDVRVFQLIVRNPRRNGRVLCRLGANTWQAYNRWGGHSLYPNGDDLSRGLIVSFDRPTPPTFFEYDVYLVGWLESMISIFGTIDYAVNFDVHFELVDVNKYKLVITSSHDEYWSKEEFDAFEHRIFGYGGNTCFMGGNTAYCQVRYADLNAPAGAMRLGRQIVCYKTSTDPIGARAPASAAPLLETSEFRANARRPETILLGGGYQSWFDPASSERPGYFVADSAHPWFKGTGLRTGDVAAAVVGYEWDNRDPAGDGLSLWDARRSRGHRIDPAAIKVLMRGSPIDIRGRVGLAEATAYTSDAGAKVFNAGSIRWSWGLVEGGIRPPRVSAI